MLQNLLNPSLNMFATTASNVTRILTMFNSLLQNLLSPSLNIFAMTASNVTRIFFNHVQHHVTEPVEPQFERVRYDSQQRHDLLLRMLLRWQVSDLPWRRVLRQGINHFVNKYCVILYILYWRKKRQPPPICTLYTVQFYSSSARVTKLLQLCLKGSTRGWIDFWQTYFGTWHVALNWMLYDPDFKILIN